MNLSVFGEIVVVLGASVFINYIFHRLKLPAVIGFILTGMLVGPSFLSLVVNTEMITFMAEVGVAMLLFIIGLELSLEHLKRMGKTFWLGGGTQVLLTLVIAYGAFMLFGLPSSTAILFGFLLAHTSTTVLLRIASDRGEVDAPHVRTALGISIFQDISFVPMLALLPALTAAGAVSVGLLSLRLGLSLAALAAVFIVARVAMPKLLFWIVGTRARDLFVFTALFVCLGMALISSKLGMSLALGAFLAGIIISESDYSHQVVSDILPFKDVFSGLFFISIGMLFDVRGALANWEIIPLLLAIAVGMKLLTGFAGVRALGFPPSTAFISSLGLIPIGEFSFVLATVALGKGLLTENIYQAFITMSILTILVTPILLGNARAMAAGLGRLFKWRAAAPEPQLLGKELNDHVIIAGFGMAGRNLAKVLKETGLAYVILELNPETVRSAAAEGEPIIFGNVSSRVLLREVCIEKAKIIVFAVSDPISARRGVQTAREMNRDLYIIVRTRFASEVDELISLGADDVVPEEFETSVEIFIRVLDRFHIPQNVIDAQVAVLRSECYGILRGTCRAFRPTMDKITDLLSAGTAETYYIGKGAWPADRNLKDIALREKTGATILAVVRGEEFFTSPDAEFKIQTGDTLILVANHRDMDVAFRYLKSGDA